MPQPSIEILLLAGRALFLLASFTVAAVVFARWRREASRDTERLLALSTQLLARLDALETRLGAADARLATLAARLEETPAQPTGSTAPSYRIAVRLAQHGAAPEELMASCGLTRQEAELVRRLHGPARPAHARANAA